MLKSYLQQVFSKLKTGEAGERTYYPVLEELLKNFQEGSQIIVEPRKSAVGIPDFKVQTEKGLLVGYVEAKDLGRDLDRLTKGEHEQIDKYRKEYPKLIVTNFIEFRLYESGEQVDSVVITQPVTLKIGTPVLDNEGRARGLFGRFYSTTIQQVHSAKRLSELLAHKTRVLRGLIREEIDLTDKEETETEKLLETFKKTLKPDMTPEIFSDMYAQTITFGLFVARINSDHEEFTRHTAHSLIPHTIPLLKKIFWILSGQDVSQHIEWQVDEIAEILANTNIQRITEEFFSHGKGRDPIIHFYETFLAEYDSSQREQLGVYYTPQPVVSYITKSLHKILKKSFGKKEGFADTSVITLDPAAGTLTFPAEAITIAKHEFESSHGTGGWDSLVKTHILKNFYAFEILMAPYAVGHLKISLLLKGLGYQMGQDERFELYLTNTLDMSKFQPQQAMLAEEISQESERAFEIKNKVPVLVVMGNPPYSGHSSNKGEWIEKQIEEYKKVDGKPLGEKNPKWLNDDYVKFIRFAQWKIEKTGQGILGYITNHAWLDNPTFRGMRDSLMKSFDEIYILNLHGSALKKEKVPEEIQTKEKIGERDEGVFGIRPGTSITLAVKSNESKSGCKVYYAEQWGLRNKKFEWLDNHDLDNTEWKILTPNTPSYFFVEKNEEIWDIYKNFTSLVDIFPLNSIGIQSHRDNLVVDFDVEPIKRKFRMLWNSDLSDQMIADGLEIKDTNTWKIAEKRSLKIVGEDWEKKILPVLYRPFDTRWIFYHKEYVDRPRNAVMEHMAMGDNLMLLVPRSVGDTWEHAFVSNSLVVDVAISARSREANQSFPLYLHNDMAHQGSMFDDGGKSQNINWDSLPGWMAGIQPITSPATDNFIQVPEAIFYYIYAVLYSNIYRGKYQEFLKSDFPRIPFTDDYKTFQYLVILGEQLVEFHLLKSKLLSDPVSRYEGKGDDRVGKRDYHEDSNRLYINGSQYFDKVAPEVWNYYIGGYQVLDKWLKDRSGRVLSLEDQLHFRKVITALTQTIDIQERIDKFYPDVEKSLDKEVKE
ncbi:N-6 DNA methylase [Candidatus Gottesmanbacteria bacterium]|nr:N-6 DNA methylase [Candidatus Gottesmanbacteria bacterium]